MIGQHDQVSVALDSLTEGLRPYVEKKLQTAFKDDWKQAALASFRDARTLTSSESGDLNWDAHSLLTVMWDQWNAVFRSDLGHQERSLVSELREYRNRWAHQQEFDFDDAYRILDSVRRLLSAVGARNVHRVNRQKEELLEAHVAEQVNNEIQRASFDRAKLWIVVIYMLCCAALTYHMLTAGGTLATALLAFVILVFVYLSYQQFRMEAPLMYGPRECRRCKRIIYRKSCPYCEQPADVEATATAG